MQYYDLYADMLKQTHLLIAGATGSGKSVVINGIVTTSLQYSPEQVQYILIDPKRVELIDYKLLPHTIVYASEPDTMVQALQRAMHLIEDRYAIMQRQHVKKYNGSNVYIVIDELADLMTTNRETGATTYTAYSTNRQSRQRPHEARQGARPGKDKKERYYEKNNKMGMLRRFC